MNFKELFEGVEPKMPGAPSGIQIMTPQQFVAKAGDEKEVDESQSYKGHFDSKEDAIHYAQEKVKTFRDPEDGIEIWAIPGGSFDVVNTNNSNGRNHAISVGGKKLGTIGSRHRGVTEEQLDEINWKKAAATGAMALGAMGALGSAGSAHARVSLGADGQMSPSAAQQMAQQGFQASAEKSGGQMPNQNVDTAEKVERSDTGIVVHHGGKEYKGMLVPKDGPTPRGAKMIKIQQSQMGERGIGNYTTYLLPNGTAYIYKLASQSANEGVAEGLDRIRKLSGLEEATKLPASSREFGGDEFQDYMKRIVGTPDVDKKTGEVKKQKDRVTKKGEVVPGKEKYISGKTKSDKYKLPYIHRNSAVQYIGPDGQTFSEEKIIAALKQRPKSLLKQNEKMRHSNGDQEQFFNIGFAALTGIAVDEQTEKLIIVNTCPGAGSCKVDCFVIHQGGKIQFEGPWLNDGRILTYLLNDPDGFFNQLSSEISKEESLGKKGGYNVTIRWHDSGDFFSPEYLDMALKMAAKHPDNKFYAYTKMAGAALAKKPDNFIINWSEGAHTSQEKQVKAQDPTLSSTKNSRIVPEEMFQDLLARDEKKNLVKGSQGQWQLQSGKLPELKERLAKQYGLSANSILSYDEYMAKRNKIPAGMKYNVIVMGGEGDVSANDPGVLSTLLLKH